MFQLSTAHQEKWMVRLQIELVECYNVDLKSTALYFGGKKPVRMISIENVEREKTIYLKGHFEKVPILPDVIIKAKENSIFFFLK